MVVLSTKQTNKTTNDENKRKALAEDSPWAPLVLLAFSSALLARPKEWPSHVHVVGGCMGGLGPLPEHDMTATSLPDTVREFFAKV